MQVEVSMSLHQVMGFPQIIGCYTAHFEIILLVHEVFELFQIESTIPCFASIIGLVNMRISAI